MAITNPFRGMSKGQLYATIAGSIGVGGFLLYKHHSSTGSWNPFSPGSAGSGTTSTTQTDPVTGLPYSQDDATDPLTGLTYLAEAEQYGSVAAAEADVTQFGQSSATGSGIGVSPATSGTGTTTGTYTAETYTSNAAWAQAAQAGLTDIGYASTDVAAALGAYLTGTPVTADQAKIIQAAITEYGPPPVGTFQIIQQPASGPAATVTVPKVTGMTATAAVEALQAAGLKAGSEGAAGGAAIVNSQTPGAGTVVAPGSTVDLGLAQGTAAAAPKAAPGGFSVTPHPGYADLGWGTVTGANSYQYEVLGAGGTGTGPSHVEDQAPGNHAEHITLQPGKYRARVRAGNVAGYGPWTAYKTFTIPGAIQGGSPPHVGKA